MIVQNEVTVNRKIVICDFCRSVMPLGEQHCAGCQKHACSKCVVHLQHDPWTGEHLGDVSVRVCRRCDAKLPQFAKMAENIRREAEKQISRLKDAWKYDCRDEEGACDEQRTEMV